MRQNIQSSIDEQVSEKEDGAEYQPEATDTSDESVEEVTDGLWMGRQAEIFSAQQCHFRPFE